MNITSHLVGKKRFVAAAAVAAMLGGGAYAFAASLSVSSTTLSAGSSAVASCNASAKVSYTTAWDATTQTFDVATVTVTTVAGSPSVCAGDDVDAVLQGTGPTTIADLGHNALASNGSYTWTLTASEATAAAVTNVSVAITG